MDSSYGHLSIGSSDNEGAFEDILGNQYALNAHDFFEDLKQKKGNFSDVDMDHVGVSEQRRIFIDLDTIESDVEIVSHSGLSSPSPMIKKENLDPLTAPANTKKVIIDLSESDNEGDVVMVDKVPGARIKEEELQQHIGGENMEIPKDGGTDASIQPPNLAPNQPESTLNLDQSSPYTSIFGRASVDDSAFKGIQQKFMARTLKNPLVTGAGSMFKGLQDGPPEPERSLRGIEEGEDARIYDKLEG